MATVEVVIVTPTSTYFELQSNPTPPTMTSQGNSSVDCQMYSKTPGCQSSAASWTPIILPLQDAEAELTKRPELTQAAFFKDIAKQRELHQREKRYRECPCPSNVAAILKQRKVCHAQRKQHQVVVAAKSKQEALLERARRARVASEVAVDSKLKPLTSPMFGESV